MTGPGQGYRQRMPLTRSRDDATVVITGASSGIGAATAYALARRGADVVLAARTEEALHRVAEHCRKLGGQALVVPTDVTDPEAVQRLAARAAVKADTGRRYRLYPTEEQAQRLASRGHTCRWLYNSWLDAAGNWCG